MAGYYLYTLSGPVFSQLTTIPTQEQAAVFAAYIHRDAATSEQWPDDLATLTAAIRKRFGQSDWYGDLSRKDARIWDNIILSLCRVPGEEVGIDCQLSDYESIYWDCAEEAAAQGAEMMGEPIFGSSGFRYFGPLAQQFGYPRSYSIFEGQLVRTLFAQLRAVESHFARLPDKQGGRLHEQFFQGLMPSVQFASENNRVLFVQTDT